MTKFGLPCFVLALVAAVGCTKPSAPAGPAPAGPQPETQSKFLLSAEPDGAVGVAETRKSAKDQDDVVVVGRIGGDADPWVEGAAAFLIADTSLVPCNERPGDDCPVPWDYCCDLEQLPDSRAMVKFVDDDGEMVKTAAKELLGVKELQTVVVKGKAQRDEAGNLTILASGMFVRP